jgi:hypothetical protein
MLLPLGVERNLALRISLCPERVPGVKKGLTRGVKRGITAPRVPGEHAALQKSFAKPKKSC